MTEMHQYIRNTEAIFEKLYYQNEKIKNLYPQNDIRKSFMGIPASVINSYKLHLCAIDQTVTRYDWWKRYVSGELTDTQIEGSITEMFSLSNRSYIIFYFAKVEFLMKKTINFFSPGFDPKHSKPFKQIYDKYLQILGLVEYIDLYDIVRLFRNTIHSNGYYINSNDEKILYKNRTFEFISLQPAKGFDMNAIFFLLDEISSSLIDIVNSTPMKKPDLIEDKFH